MITWWEVVVGKPVMKYWKLEQKKNKDFGNPDQSHIGKSVNGLLYCSRKQAEVCAKEFSEMNKFWRYHVRKMS